MLKLFSIDDDGAKYALTEDSLQDLDGETFTICSNQLDTLAFGGSDNKVYTQKVNLVEDEDADDLEREFPALAMSFDTPVNQVQFCNSGQYLLGFSEDKIVQIMNLETQKVSNIVKGMHECSVRNAAVDPYFECLATTGCDGSLHITSIKDLNNTSLIKKLKISKTQVKPESPQMFGLAWS